MQRSRSLIRNKSLSTKGCSLILLFLAAFLTLFWGLSEAAPVEEWTVSLHSSRLVPGAVERIDLSPGNAVSSARLLWKGETIPLVPLMGEKSLTAFFGIPRDESPGDKDVELVVAGPDGKVARYVFTLLVLPKEFPVQKITLPESKVSPGKTDLTRHRREQRAVKEAYARLRREPLWRGTFERPVPGKVISPFGLRRLLNGKPRSSHSGLDLRVPQGDPVAASAGGVVILTGDHFFSGRSVYIDHGMGIVTMYFHLSEIRVEPGEVVEAGQTIGLAGSTGRSTGPHLHWGARVHDCMVDPLALLKLLGEP
jgi:murein DD-endopeptidase MepM/ murein hydrolase activator NlpD